MELWIDGKMAGRIDDVRIGSTVGFRVVEPPVKPPVAGGPCPCQSGKALADCHGAEQAGSSAVEG